MPDDSLGGWNASARAYIGFQDRGDRNRTILLDPVMLRLSGDVAGKHVLDLGCGEGRFSRMLAERGAMCTGIDVTREMSRAARSRDASRNQYLVADAARLPFTDASFDLVVSYITLVDIPDYRGAIAESGRVLRDGGTFVAANLGFPTASATFTTMPSGSTTGWVRDDAGKRLYYTIDRYAEEREMWFEWAGIRIKNHHRPLSNYMRAYIEAGLILRDFEEPIPESDAYRDDPDMEDWFRLPLFTAMRWQKAG
jgi:ubiquinone/menaquinone biosynthesis C-methylase UbiE